MSRNRKFVQIYASTGDSDVAATNEIDLGPYVHAGVIELEGVWLFHDLGVASDTDHTFDCHFEESATTVDSDFSDISGASFTQGTTASDDNVNQISFTAVDRYLRAYLTMGGTAVSAYNLVGVIAIPRFDT